MITGPLIAWIVGIHSFAQILIFGIVQGCAGAVFQLVPQRFKSEIGVITGPVGMTGGIGGFYLASSMGHSKQLTGSNQLGLLIFAALAGVALLGLTIVKSRWRTTWGSAAVTAARV